MRPPRGAAAPDLVFGTAVGFVGGVLLRISSPARARLAVLLAVSEALRIWLAIAGGQGWWPDESRFDMSLAAVRAALLGQWHEVLVTLFGSADHVGFKVLGVVPALAVTAGAPLWVAAVFFGAFSAGSIYLVWRIALLASADESVAWWSAFFAAISVSLFYYSRHLLPYDPALFCGLYAIVVGLRDARPGSAFIAGIWAGMGFLTYNGYWLFCGAALLVAVVGRGGRPRALARRFVAGGGGLVLPIVAAVLLGKAAGKDLFRGAVGFAQTVNFGDFDDGWSFAWKYFQATEGWLVVVWILALAGALAVKRQRTYVLRWVAAIAFIYVGLGVMSTVAHQFVVYGRIARCLVPFIALICGAAMAGLRERAGALTAVAVAVVLAVAAVPRFALPLRQWFPDRFAAEGRDLIAQHRPTERLRILNAYSLYRPVFVSADAIGESLFARSHPLAYPPFLFENLNRQQRDFFRSHDLTMRVVRLRADAPGMVGFSSGGLAGYPGPLRVVVRLPGDGTGYSPLVVTGASARAGDYLTVLRVGPNRYRFSLVHWYAPERLSAELPLDEKRDHVIDVALGSLLPPAGGTFTAPPAWAALRRWAYVSVDGQPVFDAPAAFHPATPGEIDVGCNYIGGMTTDPRFRGEIRGVTALAPDEVLREARAALPLRPGS